MAKKKDSPWFKFKVNDWINGDITLESLSVQGAFINICAYYWSKSCEINYFAVCKKFKKATIDALIKSDLLKRDGENVRIEFLDEQWVDRSEQSQVKSEAGKKGMSNRYNKEVTPVTDQLYQSLTIKNKSENKKESEREKPEPITHKPSLAEIYWTDLPNSTFFETACRDLGRPKNEMLTMLPEFKKSRRTDYKNIQDLADHFKFWCNKQVETQRVESQSTGYKIGQKPNSR